jgi:hypothetical protein
MRLVGTSGEPTIQGRNAPNSHSIAGPRQAARAGHTVNLPIKSLRTSHYPVRSTFHSFAPARLSPQPGLGGAEAEDEEHALNKPPAPRSEGEAEGTEAAKLIYVIQFGMKIVS